MPEKLQTKEFLRQINGLTIITKNMRSSCPLANLIARSGLDEALPQLPIEVRLDQGQDYQPIVQAGNHTGMTHVSLDLEVNSRRPFVVTQRDGFVAVSLYTYMIDGHARNTSIGVGMRGTSKPDKSLGHQLFIDMFPNLKFVAVDSNLSFQDVRNYAEQNTVPHPTINFSL